MKKFSYLAPVPLLMAFVMLIINAEMTIANLAVNQLAQTFQTDIAHLQWIMSAYMLALSSSLILSGCLVDKYGSQRILKAGLFLFGISSVIVGFAPDFLILVASRIMQGLSASLLFLAAVTQLFHSFPTERKSLAQAYTGIASAMAIAFAPLLGGALMELGGWRIIFLINVPLVLLVAWGMRYGFAKNEYPINAKRIPYFNATIMIVGLICLVQGITQLDSLESQAIPNICFLLLAGTLLSSYVLLELRSENPLIEIKQLKNRICLFPSLIRFLLQGMMFFYYFSIVLLAQNVFRLDSVETALTFIIPGLAIGFSNLICGKIFDSYGYLVPLRLFCLLSIFGCSALFITEALSLWAIILINSLLLFVVSMINAGLNTYVLTQSDPKKIGATNGVIGTFAFVGASLTLVIASLIMFNYSNQEITLWLTMHHLSVTPEALAAIHHLATTNELSARSNFTPAQLAIFDQALPHALLIGYRYAMLFFACLSTIAFLISLPMQKHKLVSAMDPVCDS